MNKDALREAMALRRAGNVAKAREISHGLLSSLPDDTDVLLFAGQIELQAGAPELALRLLDRALALQPSLAPAYFAKGVALQSVRRFEDALKAYAQALTLEPAHAMSHYNIGILLQGMGRNEEAAQSYAAAARAQPDYGDALFNLGVVLNAMSRFGEAADAFDRLLQQSPRDPQAWFNLGLAHYWNGNFEGSLSAVDRALALQPSSPDVRAARAMVLEALARREEAVRDYEQAFAGGFKDAQAFNRYGNLLLGLGRAGDAIRALSIAAELAPEDADILNSRGVALSQIGQTAHAMDDFRKAISLKADFIEAYSNAGDTAVRLGHAEEALSALAHAMRGEAKTPSEIVARDNAVGQNIFFRRQLCLWDELDDLQRHAADRIRSQGVSIDPFKAVIAYDDPALHRLCADRAVGRGPAVAPIARPVVKRTGKLRIGYLSADFHDHATTRLMAELFELHDRARFEVIAYSYGRDDGSAMRKRVVAAFDAFNDVPQLSDLQIAEKIAKDGVHILVDLKGHTREARLDILKHKPAPVQAHYIGFPGTLGGGLVDYMIADAVTVPFDQAANYSEAVVHLPRAYQVNDRRRDVAARTPTRAECGLPEQAFVLCGFAQPFKVSPDVFDAWARIMAEVPQSVLWMLSYNAEMEANLRREIAARGVDSARLIFAPPMDLADHLARHKVADLYLDTRPYGAHTSASDALWVGLPVITSPGRSFASRVSASLLQSIGAPELIAASHDDYVAIAVSLARAPERLTALRAKLRSNRDTAPLFDTDLFRRGIEAAYLRMWEIFERGEKPHQFAVDKV